MGKKKDNFRAKFQCNQCGCSWVYHEPYCPVCKILGMPMNDRAKRLIKKYLTNGKENRIGA